jgi:hypothetical protein
MRPTWRALFAPHCEQNLYANPKRTAKFHWLYVRCAGRFFVQTNFPFAIPGQQNSRFKQSVADWGKMPKNRSGSPQPA